jgi:hypothetical protein
VLDCVHILKLKNHNELFGVKATPLKDRALDTGGGGGDDGGASDAGVFLCFELFKWHPSEQSAPE